MLLARRGFTAVDMFSVNAGLKAGGNSKVKSASSGIISFLLIGVFLYFILSNCLEVIQYKRMDYSEKETKLKKTKVSAEFPMFAVTVDTLSESQILSMFTVTVEIVKNKTVTDTLTLIQCKPEHWAALGDGYEDQFYQAALDFMLCPKTDETFKLKQTYRSTSPEYVVLKISPCDSSTNTDCQPGSAWDYITSMASCCRGAEISVFVLDDILYPDEKQVVNKYVNVDTKSVLTDRMGEQVFVQFATYKVNTDWSLLPNKDIRSEGGTQVDAIRNAQFPISNLTTGPYTVVTFTMNQKLVTTTRKAGKLSQAFSESGGIISLLTGFFAFFIVSYNAHKYDLQVADKTFKDEPVKITPDQFNFFTYAKFTLYTYIKKFTGKSMDWQICKNIEKTKKQSSALMDVGKLFKRLDHLQTTIAFTVDKNQDACLHLVEPVSVDEAKFKRLMLTYYQKVMFEKDDDTLEEAKKTYEAEKLNMLEFYEQKLSQKNQKKSDDPVSPKYDPSASLTSDYRFLQSLDNVKIDQIGIGPIPQGNKQNIEIVRKNSNQENSNDSSAVNSRFFDSSDGFKNKVQKLKDSIGDTIKQEEPKVYVEGDLETLEKVLNCFEQIKKAASQYELSGNYKKTQKKLARHFQKLTPASREKLQLRIPIFILHRLMMSLNEAKQLKAKLKQLKREQRKQAKQKQRMERSNSSDKQNQKKEKKDTNDKKSQKKDNNKNKKKDKFASSGEQSV